MFSCILCRITSFIEMVYDCCLFACNGLASFIALLLLPLWSFNRPPQIRWLELKLWFFNHQWGQQQKQQKSEINESANSSWCDWTEKLRQHLIHDILTTLRQVNRLNHERNAYFSAHPQRCLSILYFLCVNSVQCSWLFSGRQLTNKIDICHSCLMLPTCTYFGFWFLLLHRLADIFIVPPLALRITQIQLVLCMHFISFNRFASVRPSFTVWLCTINKKLICGNSIDYFWWILWYGRKDFDFVLLRSLWC